MAKPEEFRSLGETLACLARLDALRKACLAAGKASGAEWCTTQMETLRAQIELQKGEKRNV